jgi:hypothetical protein
MKTIMIPLTNRRWKAKAETAACSGMSSHENLSRMVNKLGLGLSTSNPDANRQIILKTCHHVA